MAAVRRLGGSLALLQGRKAAAAAAAAAATSSAVAEGRRRLLLVPRRIHTDEHAKAPRIFAEYPEGEIQQKKEELYSLISQADQQFVGEVRNRRLLQFLSEYVEPRPHDPEWRRLTRTMKVARWIYFGGFASSICLIGWQEVEFAKLENAWGLRQASIEQQRNAT